ncbi:NPCBM/NEW2 domain-containing protein [Crossiella sp. SN42]|uniref:NPCBM/NEW2 domain-containing protein n=1 Tax=Crossiella sp. SN42 TaxID=2944808 RepID=UPI0035AB84D4
MVQGHRHQHRRDQRLRARARHGDVPGQPGRRADPAAGDGKPLTIGGTSSVVFEVHADGVRKAATGVLTGAGGPTTVTADVGGAEQLRLVVTDGGDNINHDHADWAEAKLTCG